MWVVNTRARYYGLWLLLGSLLPLAAQANVTNEYQLDNGLKLIVREDHRAPVVVNMVWYRIGSSYEQNGHTGLSHLLEHMMFKGTEKYKSGEFSRLMAENGAKENAFTSPDYTAYYQAIASDRLPLCFELEADRMRYLTFDEKEFLKEREVVIEERRLRTDDKPASLAYESFKATAYQTLPYRNPTIGWPDDLKNMTLDDLKAWYQSWYAPNNATVVVVGDVNSEEVFELAKKYFGPLQPSPQAQPILRPEVPQYGTKRIEIKQPTELPMLMMGYKVPVLKTIEDDSEAYALTLLAYVLDGDSSARLPKKLVRGQELATSLSVSYDLYSRLGDLFLFSGYPTDASSPEKLEQAILQEIKLLQTELVDDKELQRLKTQLVANKVYELDSTMSQATEIGGLESIGLSWRLLDSYVDKLDQVTPEQIRAVAQKYLTPEQLTVGVLTPLDDAQPQAQ